MSTSTFEPALLPDAVKEDLCRGLLAEFGANVTRVREPDGELNCRCVMPWHPENKPSASLNYKKLTYKCLGCGSQGGLLWLIGMARGVTGTQARDWLGTQTGLDGADIELKALLDLFDALEADRPSRREPIPKMGEAAIAAWEGIVHPYMTTGVPEIGLEGRGIPVENLLAMRVGYSPDYRVNVSSDPDSPVWAESHRIVIPHFWRGDLVGWQSRQIVDDGTPKYLSTPGFPKDQTVYNYDAVVASGSRVVLVVESPATVLRHRHHLPIVATFGKDVTDAQVRLLAHFETVVWWPDNDEAGWAATLGRKGERRGDEGTLGLPERLEPYSDVLVVDSDWAADGAQMPDDLAARLFAEAVPAPVWRIPSALRCWHCKRCHTGYCEEAA